jgi:hypothetical protein
MLIKTGRGSISFVAGCCWVNSVTQPPPAKHTIHGQRDNRKPQPSVDDANASEAA